MRRAWIPALMLLLLPAGTLAAQQVSVEAAVSAEEVFVGETFTLQVRVDGTDRVEAPRLEGFEAFQVEDRGGQANNSQSITIVNGQMSRVESRGYVFSWDLTARTAGTAVVPAVRVVAGGREYATRPIAVRVRTAEETGDYRLRLEVSPTRCYVGQAVTAVVTWYLGKDARSLDRISVPLFLEPSFTVLEAGGPPDPARALAVRVNREAATAEKGSARLDGRDYTTVTVRKVILPGKAGTYDPGEATVSFEGVAGVRTVRDFLWGTSQQADYRKLVVPSNRAALAVLDVPERGRPADWRGQVGRVALSARAAPAEAGVGDPITLTVEVSGSSPLERTELPPLASFPGFAERFKIPDEMSAGTVKDGKKVFTQTLRPKSEQVTEIPPVRLSYFDPDTGTYGTAVTQPIPLAVRAAREVTLQDVEGRDAAEPGVEVQSRVDGIAHNYEDAGVLVDGGSGLAEALASPLFLALLLAPLAGLAGTAVLVRFRKAASADPERGRSRRAHARFRAGLQALRAGGADPGAKPAALLESLREYLGARLSLSARTLTFGEVRAALEGRTDAAVLEALRAVFAECEAGRYAGFVPTEEGVEALLERAEKAVADLEGSLP